MSDYLTNSKLDEIKEQNKEIISLMKMQMVMLNPDVDFYDLDKKVRMATRESQDKALVEKQKWYARREKEKQEQEKRIREQKLKEKNAEINSIIDQHNKTFSSTPPAYPDSYIESLDR